MVGVEIAGGAAELTRERGCGEKFALLGDAVGEHLEFLAQACGRGGLAVGAGQHGHVLPFLGEGVDFVAQLLKGGHVDVLQRVEHRHRHRGVVDVLRGEAKVYEFLEPVEAHGVELLFQEIFHGLDVVIGRGLDFLDARGVGQGKVMIDVAELFQRRGGHVLELRQGNLAQGDEILDLDLHAVADKSEFRKILVEALALRPVAPVDGRDGSKRSQFHRGNDYEFQATKLMKKFRNSKCRRRPALTSPPQDASPRPACRPTTESLYSAHAPARLSEFQL